jgi:hypothetical protein
VRTVANYIPGFLTFGLAAFNFWPQRWPRRDARKSRALRGFSASIEREGEEVQGCLVIDKYMAAPAIALGCIVRIMADRAAARADEGGRARKFRQALLLRRKINYDRRRWGLTYFEAHGSGYRRSRGQQKRDVARRFPERLLAPEIEVRHQKLLSQVFLFVVGHAQYKGAARLTKG